MGDGSRAQFGHFLLLIRATESTAGGLADLHRPPLTLRHGLPEQKTAVILVVRVTARCVTEVDAWCLSLSLRVFVHARLVRCGQVGQLVQSVEATAVGIRYVDDHVQVGIAGHGHPVLFQLQIADFGVPERA